MTVKAALAGSTIDEDDESEFLTTIRAHLSETSKSVVDRLAAVKDVYVECGRDTLLDVTFKTFVEFMLATRNGRRDDGRILFVTGESGAGKSAAVRRMLSSHPALQPIQVSFGFVRPVVSVSLSGPSTLRLVGEQIMAAARGYETVRKMRQGEIWKEMPADLRHRRVLIVHIDEPQHLMKDTETNLDRRNLANALKGVMNYAQWPVSFVLSGLPIVDEIARLDEQFERRGTFVRLPNVHMPDERRLVEKVIRALANAGGVECEALIATDIPDRIAHAARYRYGRIAQIVVAALHVAFQKDEATLTRDHFAIAYDRHSHAMDHDGMNVFLANDWRRLPEGCFLIEKGEP